MPILETASGLCMLAYMPIKRQKLILKTLAKINNESKKIVNNTAVLEKKFVKILNQGFSVKNRARRFDDLTAMSVPIITEEEVVRGALTVRYSRSAISLEQAVAKFVPSLMKTSLGIASRINLHINRQQSLNNKEPY
jgi:DNA-binding IclR family transcriptional regulator